MESISHRLSPEGINRLIAAAESTMGCKARTPKDFDSLRLDVFRRTGTLLSPTTLKRIWGYLKEDVAPRRATLDALSRYAGFADLDAFLAGSSSPESGPLSPVSLTVDACKLPRGAKMLITWLPDREMEIQSLGQGEFKILRAVHTRLQEGDTFHTGLFAQGQPLYLNRLTRRGKDLGVYVCGRRSGIHFTTCDEKD